MTLGARGGGVAGVDAVVALWTGDLVSSSGRQRAVVAGPTLTGGRCLIHRVAVEAWMYG